jgi:hypothetical protein
LYPNDFPSFAMLWGIISYLLPCVCTAKTYTTKKREDKRLWQNNHQLGISHLKDMYNFTYFTSGMQAMNKKG